ncbi:MAG TPA: hypothetical protein VD906_02710 [Caulobacteraceae bacterium]|nr:hypothetical protein [Caulobacteraceae bacterium]
MLTELHTPFVMMTGAYPTASLATVDWAHRGSQERWLCWRAERRLIGKVRAVRSGVKVTAVRRNKVALDFDLTGSSLKEGQLALVELIERCEFDPPAASRLDRTLPDRLLFQPVGATLGQPPSLIAYQLMEELTKAVEVHRRLIRAHHAVAKVRERIMALYETSLLHVDQNRMHPATDRLGCLAAWAQSQASTQPQAFPSRVQFWKFVAVKARLNPAWRS